MAFPTDTQGSEFVKFEEKPLRIFPISREPLSEIQPHESVNEPDLNSFCESFREKGLFYKPILIDGESGTILDGTHRWAGLKKLGATHAPVIKFNYQDDAEIEVGTWFPIASESIDVISECLTDNGYDVSPTSFELSSRLPDNVVLVSSDQHYKVSGDPIEMFRVLEEEFDFQYTQDLEQVEDVVNRGHVGLLRPPPSKQDVVRIAKEEGSVPPKYTCHRFPYKYPHIMVSYSELIPGE